MTKRNLRASANRCVLHIKKLDVFANWAKLRGYTVEPVKGEFEVLRLKPQQGTVLIFWKRGGADHATCAGREQRLVRKWLAERDASRQEASP